MRKELIEHKMVEITDSLDIIKDNLPEEYEEFKGMVLAKEGIYKKIEFSVQNLIDICYIINSDLNLGIPEVEDSIFDNLEKNNILKKETIDLIREMKGFRNILVHKYGEIDDAKAYNDIKQGIDDFDKILSEIKDLLKKYEKVNKKRGSNEKKKR